MLCHSQFYGSYEVVDSASGSDVVSASAVPSGAASGDVSGSAVLSDSASASASAKTSEQNALIAATVSVDEELARFVMILSCVFFVPPLKCQQGF